MTSLTGQSRKEKHPQKGQDQWQVLVDQVIDPLFDNVSFENVLNQTSQPVPFLRTARTCSQANVFLIISY